jgi:hypothetical protein
MTCSARRASPARWTCSRSMSMKRLLDLERRRRDPVRVLVLEYNGTWSPAHAVTIPYDPDFRLDVSRTPYYCGASLAAFIQLSRAKGYRLIGGEQRGVNAFFLRADVGSDLFPEVAAAAVQWPTDARDHYDWGTRTWIRV